MTLSPKERGRGREALSPAYMLLGAGVLLPWNALITTTYDRFPSSHVDRAITVVYLPVTFVSTLVLAVTCGESARSRPRLLGGFSVYVVCLVLAPLLADIGWLLALVAAVGVADAAAQGALFGLAGEKGTSPVGDSCVDGGRGVDTSATMNAPNGNHSHGNHMNQAKTNTQSLVSGTSISGIVTSVVNIITRAVLPEEVQSVSYFWAIAGLCAACVFLCAKMTRRNDISATHGPSPDNPAPIQASSPGNARNLEPLQVETLEKLPSRLAILDILKKARAPLCALTMVYWVTITIFPGILQEDVGSRQGEAGGWAWTAPVATFIFNVCDAIGKFLDPLPITSNGLLLGITVSRVLFVPVFLASIHAHPALICLLTGALGLTNGMLTVTTLTKIQRDVDDAEAYLAGNIALGALLLGLQFGAATSYLTLLFTL